MNILSFLKVGLLVAVVGVASGCASVANRNPADPLEGFNRRVDGFNQAVDSFALRPIAKGYVDTVPPEVRMCVGNFFSNLGDVKNVLNNVLQLKPKAAFNDMCRIAINSTIGILGLVDVASELGFQKHDEDFGQTLGYWGVGSGPYLVLPILGPSTIRDFPARILDRQVDPLAQHDPVNERNVGIVTDAVDKRARLLPATDLVDRVALDKYSFVRDAYLARRASQIRDGAPDPSELVDDDDEVKPARAPKK